MKKLLSYCLYLTLAFSFGVEELESALPTEYYGVWERGPGDYDPQDPDYDYLRGLQGLGDWELIQPTAPTGSAVNVTGYPAGTPLAELFTENELFSVIPPKPEDYDWSAFQAIIDLAYERQVPCFFRINVGDFTPEWLYTERGVRKFATTSTSRPFYPEYYDPRHVYYIHALIAEFGKFIRNQPAEKLKQVAFVQVQTGSTGDEKPWGGELVDFPALDVQYYNIAGEYWNQYRQNAFIEYKKAFLDVDPNESLPPVFLSFNSIDTSPAYNDLWNWVIANNPNGFGFKNGNGYVRGHHLTKAREFTEIWKKYTVDNDNTATNPEGLKLFSRAEMDQSHENPLYMLNKPLANYWGAISGLQTGLSIWDIAAGRSGLTIILASLIKLTQTALQLVFFEWKRMMGRP